MCFSLGCTMSTCICTLLCNCNSQCFFCYDIKHSGSCIHSTKASRKSSDIRNKFVCFDCKHIWKSSVTKYEANKIDKMKRGEQTDILRQFCNNKFPETRSEREHLLMKRHYAYYNATSNCPKCSQIGHQVGRNFRHCKTKKEWEKLLTDYKTNKINLVADFYDYPKYIR